MNLDINLVNVGDRFRKEFTDIESLAASIARYGQLEPIILDENNTLIAGERRLRACQLLKKKEVEVKYIKELNELEKKEIELEENIQRKEFTWQEEVAAKQELHKLKQQVHGSAEENRNSGGWSLKQTAVALGESIGNVSMDIQLARGLQAFPELLKEKSKTVAYKMLKKMQEQLLQEELARRMQKAGIVQHPEVIHGNCIEIMQSMEANSVDLIVTDPPYGIDIDNSHTFGRMTISNTNFEDSDHATFDLLDRAFNQMYRILKMDRHAYVFFAIDKYEAIVSLLTKHGFTVHPMPLIWDKGSGSYPSQSLTFVHSYEPFLHISKGRRVLNGTPRDVFPIKRVPAGTKIHPTEKPTELLRDIINLSSNPGERVFDPFAGSGASLIAAKECGRQASGVELNPVYYDGICKRLGKEVKTVEVMVETEDDEEG